jgi:hypothetical protein
MAGQAGSFLSWFRPGTQLSPCAAGEREAGTRALFIGAQRPAGVGLLLNPRLSERGEKASGDPRQAALA